MKIKARAIEECTTLFEIDVSKEKITEAFREVYDEIAKVANIPGFRIGKAPKDIVKKHHAANAKEEVLKRLIPEAYRMAIEEHKISPIGLPDISAVSIDEEKSLSFKASVDTRPKFKVKNYKGIKIEKKSSAVKDEDVEKTLESLREINAKYIDEGERPVQMGDYVSSDLECFVEAKPIHRKRENVWLSIEKESLIPGLNEKMVGMKKGAERDIEVVLPAPLDQTKDNTQRGPAISGQELGIGGKKYPDKAVAGKKAVYHVKAKEIKSRKLPDLNDEFAKTLGKESLEDLRKEVRTELERRMKINTEVDLENQLLKKLMDDNVFAVPRGLVSRQINYMTEDAKRRLKGKGFKKEDLDKRDNEFAQKFKEDAVRQVRLIFIMDDIARAEGIEVNDKDVEDAYNAIVHQTGNTIEKVKEYYEKEGLIDSLRENIKEEKAIKFLLEKAEVTETG